MTTKQESDRYAAELTQRFEELVKWAIENWPKPEFPLLDSDFREARREIGDILGPKLGDGETRSPPPDNSEPFIPMSPMPWP